MTIPIIIAVLVVLAVYVIMAYNNFTIIKNKIEEAYATVEVHLKKRYDLIPNLVETVKGYAKHESKTFTDVIEARNNAMKATGFEELRESENQLQQTLKSLFALSESYPDLKANTNFMDLQRQLESIENEILQSRKYYNAVVKEFNTRIALFPNSIIAGMFRFTKKEYYEVDDVVHQNVKVSF
ncbi:MAG: LemA family protein [Clostridia bacterium]